MEIKVCIGSACHLKGSYEVIKNIENYISEHNLEEKIVLKSSFCLAKCSAAVSVEIDNDEIISMSPQGVNMIMEKIVKEKCL
ncbi:NAD(P)H-dependent oxidoreductase subunit E [Clostridiaceae bacterium HSG29]|nr:NAD(P)H-dependent oxidoreductase subunit E [Clostridiaceae bacterium HSG29]